MKSSLGIISAIIGAILAVLPAQATTYTGPGTSLGTSLADGAGINSVVVNNTASTISFTINSSQAQASYIFYAIELQIVGQAGSGYTGFSNPFGPVIGISSGENAVIDTYAAGATPYVYSGGWVANPSVSNDAGGTGSTFRTMTVPLSSLGLALGSSFYFDVVSTYTAYSSGGPQAAYGTLDSSTGYPAEANGSYNPYSNNTWYDSATDINSTFNTGASLYNVVQPVPEPTTFALMGLGFAGIVGRKLLRRSK
jgi:PEP-CTERM motif